ncbi:MAG: sugar phosphate isomerase/epimerase family protein [Armatimonadota bacterium]
MDSSLDRRQFFARSGAAAAAAGAAALARPAEAGSTPRKPFRFCLNTSTIRGQKLPLEEEVDLAARAGYDAIEPWIGEIDDYVKRGGSLRDLARRISDRGLTVESAIGFPEWIVEDEARRQRGLDEAKRSMELVKQLGGKRIAAPPVGAQGQNDALIELPRAAERYRALCELGQQMEVVPQAEVWGFSRNMSRLGETAFVVIEAGHPFGCILPDIYHLHRGGSGFGGLRQLSGESVQVFHMNDYPAEPPAPQLNDAHRVYPGDGVAPIPAILRSLIHPDRTLVLSLELFNPDYWKQDAFQVAKTGLEKMRSCAAKALEQRSA